MGNMTQRLADAVLAWGLNAGVKQAGLHRSSITLSFGNISYLSNQVQAGSEAIVMLHGIVANAHSWPAWIKELKLAQSRIIAPDLPGHGSSVSTLDLDYGIAAQAERIKELVAALGINRVHLVGNSMGGAIALHWAATAPDLVASLVLIAPAGWHHKPSWLHNEIARTGSNPMVDVQTVDQYRAMLRIGMTRPPTLANFIVRALLRDYTRRQALNLKVASDILCDLDQTPYLAQISAPVLIIWGELDQVLHVDNARFLQQQLRYSRLLLVPNAGHITMLDAPAAVASACRDFYAALPATSNKPNY